MAAWWSTAEGAAAIAKCRAEDSVEAKDSQSNVKKVVVLGAAGAGKTALIQALCGYDMPKSYSKTLGLAVHRCRWPVKIAEMVQVITFEFWDANPATYKAFPHMQAAMVDGVHVVMPVVSLEDRPSFNIIDEQHAAIVSFSHAAPPRVCILTKTTPLGSRQTTLHEVQEWIGDATTIVFPAPSVTASDITLTADYPSQTVAQILDCLATLCFASQA